MTRRFPKLCFAAQAKILLEIVVIVALLVFACYYINRDMIDWQPSPALSNLARPSLMWAAGHGFHEFADPDDNHDRISDNGGDLLSNAVLASPIEKRALTHLQKTHLYLCYLLGICWRIFGIEWAVAKNLVLFFLVLNALLLYGFCRQTLNRFFSIVVVCLFLMSIGFYGEMDLRDVSKAPFYSATFLLLALVLKQPAILRRYLTVTFALAVIIGIGLGFRRDMLVLAVFVMPVILFCPGKTLLLRYRLSAVVVYLSILTLLALPIDALSFHERGQDNIRIICGFAGESEYFLPISQASYMKEPLAMNDDYGLIVSQAAAKTGATMPKSQYQGLVGTSDADTLYSSAYLNALLRYFPFDLTVRAFSAVAYITQGQILQLSSVFKWAMILTPIVMALLLLMIASWAPWRATLMLYLILVFCGYVSLQFQPRHYFHLTFVPIWIWAVALYLSLKLLHQLFRDRNKEVRFYASHFYALCKNSASWGAVICLLAASLLYGFYRYQESKVLAMRDAYENADRTLIAPHISQWGDNLLLGVDMSECTSETDFLRLDKLIHKTLMIEIECTDEPFILGTSYYGYKNLSCPLEISRKGVNNGDIIRIYVPVYEWHALDTPMFFNGLVISPKLNQHVLNIYEVDNQNLLPMILVVTDNKHSFISRQRISFWRQKPQNVFFDNYRELRDEDYIQIIQKQIETFLGDAVDLDYHKERLVRHPKSVGHYMLLFRTELLHAKHNAIAPLFHPLIKTFPNKFMVILHAFDLCIHEVSINPLLLWKSLDESYPEAPVIDSLFSYALYQTITDRKWHGSISGQENEYRSQILHLANKVLRVPFTDIEPPLALGDTLIAIGERDTALQIYSAIMEKTPSSLSIASHINLLFQGKNGLSELCAFWRKIAGSHPNVALPQLQMGLALDKNNEHDQAAHYYQKAVVNYRAAIVSDPGNLANHYGLAQSLEAQEKYDEALDIYHEVMSGAPESPKTAGRIDALYVSAGRRGDLTELWKQYVGMHPTAAIPHFHLGLAFEREGLYEHALEELDKALAIDPNLNAAMELRAAIIAKSAQ